MLVRMKFAELQLEFARTNDVSEGYLSCVVYEDIS